MDTSRCSPGSQWALQVPLTDPATGLPYDGYDPTVYIDCTVTGGPDNSAGAAQPLAAWDAATPGLIDLYLSPAQTQSLAAGFYSVTVRVDDPAGGYREVLLLELEVVAPPVAAPPAYCEYRDLLDHGGGWLTAVPVRADLVAGFARQRGLARGWLDGVILAHWDGSGCGLHGWGAGPGREAYLRGVLDRGGLILTPQVVRIAALKSLAFVARAQTGQPTADSVSPYAGWAADYDREADRQARCLVAGIDTTV